MGPPIVLSDAPGCCVLKWTCFTDATARIAVRRPTTCGWDGSSAPFGPWSPDAWRPYRTIPCLAMPIRNRIRRRRNALAVNDRPRALTGFIQLRFERQPPNMEEQSDRLSTNTLTGSAPHL